MYEEEIINPRYPHRIKIVRRDHSISGWGADEDDPLAEPQPELVVNTPLVSTPLAEGGKVLASRDYVPEETVLYDGRGRSFTDTTTNGNVEVDTNKRKASIPVRYDEWGAGEKPLDGDTIYVTVGRNTEIGRVRDCEPDNNRSLVYWDFVRV